MDIEFLERYQSLIGVDEVGRGPIAGPVCACAVKLRAKSTVDNLRELGVTDSKKLTDKKRKTILEKLNIDFTKLELDKVIHVVSGDIEFSFVLSELCNAEIDKVNILQASLISMKNCVNQLESNNSFVLIDGNKTFDDKENRLAVVKGDAKSVAIGMASVIAKIFRDEKMAHYSLTYPGYGLEKHAGYPTKTHKEAVANLGPTPIHRKTFKGVKEYI